MPVLHTVCVLHNVKTVPIHDIKNNHACMCVGARMCADMYMCTSHTTLVTILSNILTYMLKTHNNYYITCMAIH